MINESELIAQKRAYQTPDEHLYRDIKNAWQLKPADLAVLRELAAWRRNKAIRKNLALNFVLKEHCLVELAKRKPTSLTAMRNVPEVDSIEVNRRLIDFPSYKKVAKEIKQKITAVAKKQGIPEDVFASKKQINQLISWNWKLTSAEREQTPKPDLLNSWRYEYLKDTLKEWDV